MKTEALWQQFASNIMDTVEHERISIVQRVTFKIGRSFMQTRFYEAEERKKCLLAIKQRQSMLIDAGNCIKIQLKSRFIFLTAIEMETM
jgi:hypothetical protein